MAQNMHVIYIIKAYLQECTIFDVAESMLLFESEIVKKRTAGSHPPKFDANGPFNPQERRGIALQVSSATKGGGIEQHP